MKAGIAPYVDRSEGLGLSRSGWAWDAKLDDFNNDGTLEASGDGIRSRLGFTMAGTP